MFPWRDALRGARPWMRRVICISWMAAGRTDRRQVQHRFNEILGGWRWWRRGAPAFFQVLSVTHTEWANPVPDASGEMNEWNGLEKMCGARELPTPIKQPPHGTSVVTTSALTHRLEMNVCQAACTLYMPCCCLTLSPCASWQQWPISLFNTQLSYQVLQNIYTFIYIYI